jgi:hypothetical protein
VTFGSIFHSFNISIFLGGKQTACVYRLERVRDINFEENEEKKLKLRKNIKEKILYSVRFLYLWREKMKGTILDYF